MKRFLVLMLAVLMTGVCGAAEIDCEVTLIREKLAEKKVVLHMRLTNRTGQRMEMSGENLPWAGGIGLVLRAFDAQTLTKEIPQAIISGSFRSKRIVVEEGGFLEGEIDCGWYFRDFLKHADGKPTVIVWSYLLLPHQPKAETRFAGAVLVEPAKSAP